LALERPFDHYRFIELDPRRAAALGDLNGEFSNLDVGVEVAEANTSVQRIAAGFGQWNLRGVAFLDPYGAHLHWATLEALAATGKFDVILNFPLEMAINRLLPLDGNIRPSWRAQLDACFGTSDWFAEAYSAQNNLLGECVVKRSDALRRLLQLYVRRLDALFGNVAGPSLVKNTRGLPLYHLLWAASNPRGRPIAGHILGLGNRVAVPRKPADARPIEPS
jgi:three-Cys-motif partner protein